MAATKKLSSLFSLLSLICFISFFLLLSVSRKASISSSTTHPQFLCFKSIDVNPTPRSDPSATNPTVETSLSGDGSLVTVISHRSIPSSFFTLTEIPTLKWCPAGADRGFTFLHYNLAIAYHRTSSFGTLW